MRKRIPVALVVLVAVLLAPLAGCTRAHDMPGDSRLLIDNLTDETPYDRPHTDKGEYIQNLPR